MSVRVSLTGNDSDPYASLEYALKHKDKIAQTVSPENRQAFMDSEVFIIDGSEFTYDDEKDFSGTFSDMLELGLDRAPAKMFSIYFVIQDQVETGKSRFSPCFYICKDDMRMESCEPIGLYGEENGVALVNIDSDADAERIFRFAASIYKVLLVMLISKGVVKEREAPSKAALLGIGKKGKGGVTRLYIRDVYERNGDKLATGIHRRPHFRRGHIRKLDPEDKKRWVWVSPCFVNGEPDKVREAYQIKGGQTK